MASPLARFNQAMRGTKTVQLRLTVTTVAGDTQSVDATVKLSKLNKINGPGLTSHNVYTLRKTGRVQTIDSNGTQYTYELLAATQFPSELIDAEIQLSSSEPATSDEPKETQNESDAT